MHAVYAFMRITDDLSDAPGPMEVKAKALQSWQAGLQAALAGQYRHRIHAGLVWAIQHFQIPVEYLKEVIAGVQRDLQPLQFSTQAELLEYCYQVASVVGLSCLPIWGFQPGVAITDAAVQEPAIATGYAFQMTNILRDIGEDLQLGRMYLPVELWRKFDCPPESWSPNNPAFVKMMNYQIGCAQHYYQESQQLRPLLSPGGQQIFQLMSSAYEQLLQRIAQNPAQVLRQRVRLAGWQKLRLALRVGWLRWMT